MNSLKKQHGSAIVYRKGIENIPLRDINKSMPIMVFIRDLNAAEEDDVVAEYRLDYANYNDRKHLGRLTFWAVSNHHLVETIAVVDAEGGPNV